MSIFTKLGVNVAAPFNADGTPRKISPQDFQIWMTEVERLIKGLVAGIGGVELPDLIYKYWITGGNENAIIAKPNATPPTAAGEALFTIEITHPNTSNVKINGKPLLTSSGNQIAPGGLVPGIWAFLDDGNNFRLLSDQASQSIVQLAESAAADANAAKIAAESAAGNNWFAFDTVSAVEAVIIPAPVNYVRTAGYSLVADGGGALYKRVSEEPSHAGKIQSADGAWWELAENVVNIKALGAKPDSTGVGTGTDNSAILLNSILCAIALRKNIYVPAGKYRLATQVVYDKSSLNADSTALPNIIGDGITLTRFYCDSGGLRLFGSLAPGFYVSWIEVKDIQFIGNNRSANSFGIDVENQGFLRLERVKCSGFDKGIRLKGVISTKIEQPYLSNNNIGIHALADDTDAWPPNAITVDQPWIGSNTRAGIVLDKPATFNIRGGSVEGNGTNTAIGVNQRGGILINSPGLGGHAAIVSDGVYYEYNSGVADVLFFGTSREVASTFSGNTFTRMGANPTNSCIAVYSVSHKFSLSLDGNGFGELGSGAVASGPYIDVERNTPVRVSERGNTYQNLAYAPSFNSVMADCEQTRPIAMGYVSAAGALSGTGVNVGSVAKVGAGQYKITLATPVDGRKYALTTPGSARLPYTLTFDAGSITVGFANNSGVDTDTEFGFVIYATAMR